MSYAKKKEFETDSLSFQNRPLLRKQFAGKLTGNGRASNTFIHPPQNIIKNFSVFLDGFYISGDLLVIL